MKKIRKVLALTLCAIALVGASVMGTMAYLTDNDTVTNTFTVGNVDITLDEAKVDEYGVKDGDNRWQPTVTDTEQEYKLLPNHTYVKDPTVTVEKDSEDAYVRMLVTVNDISKLKAAFPQGDYATWYADEVFLLQQLVEGWDNSVWTSTQKVKQDGNEVTYEFRYKEKVAKSGEDKKLEPLFTSIKVPGEVDNAHLAYLKDVKIIVEAHAIQADGFNSADEAWEKFTNDTPWDNDGDEKEPTT
ncbi:MAG: hypothetical protein IJE29_06790 [Firmicutes bacterium]|nr:hypothetical protein [Bacillota bacterium]